MRILIADDSETDLKILTGLLKRQGDCQTAVTGTEVLRVIKQAIENRTPFNLLCLDILLPDMAGHDVLTQIRNLEKSKSISKNDRLKIIMITGMHDVKNILKATNLGCDGYVTKPVDKERLMIELSKLGLVVSWE